MLPQLFETLVEMSSALGTEDDQKRAVWSDIASHIHPYPRGTIDGNDEIFLDYDDCDKIQSGGITSCLWSVNTPVFPLGTVGLNSSSEEQNVARASIAAWAKHLKCAKSTVVATATWKQLKRAQQKAKAEGMKDRRRKPKASDSRRD